MKIEIPNQLKNPYFRFLLLKKGDKEPIEKVWEDKNNYAYNDHKLLRHIEQGKNYGIIGGFGNIVFVDADSPTVTDLAEELPETFTVKSGSKEEYKKHYFFEIEDEFKGIRLSKHKAGDLGDIRCVGQYVVAPNSYLKESNNYYKIIKNIDITKISFEVIKNKFIHLSRDKGGGVKKDFLKDTTKRDTPYIKHCKVLDYFLNHKIKGNSSKNWEVFRYLTDLAYNRNLPDKVLYDICQKQNHSEGAIKGWLQYAKEGKLQKSSCELMKSYLEHYHPEIINGLCGKCELGIKNNILKTKERKKEEKDNTIYTSLYLNEEKNIIAEQIYDEKGKGIQFCLFNTQTEQILYHNSITEGELIYKPILDEEVKKKAVLLPSKAEPYENDKKLDEDILVFINKWLDIPEDKRRFALWNIKRSWVYERFNTLNYLRALGDFGGGKTRFLDTLGSLHYKAIQTSGAATAAPVFRIIDKWRGSLIMDEADFQKSDEAQDMIKIINLGFEKGKQIMRCDQNDANKINFFDPYCPKILATRREFTDKATESRCITEIMIGTTRTDIPVNLNDDFFNEAQTLRNKLLMWRFKNYYKIDVNKTIDLDLNEIEPRVRQMVNSLIPLFNSDEEIELFKKFVIDKQAEVIENRQNSYDGIIVLTIYDFIKEFNTQFNASDVIEKGNIMNSKGKHVSPRSLSSNLKALGFTKTKVERIRDTTKKCIPIDSNKLLLLFNKYGLDVTDVTVVTVLWESLATVTDQKFFSDLCYNYNIVALRNNSNNSNIVTQQKQEIIEEII